MFKKISVIALLLSLVLSLAGCMGGGGATLDEVSKESVVRIEDFLGEASSYYQLADSSLVISETTDKAKVLDAYINAATELKAVPDELVNSYVESFKAAVDASADEEELKTTAKSLIKEELVIHLAYSALKCAAITDEMRTDMAKKIAAELNCDTAAIFTPGNSTYTVDTAIKEDLIKEKLESAWDKANGTTEESAE